MVQADLQTKLLGFVDELKMRGTDLLARDEWDLQTFQFVLLGCRHIATLIGHSGETWRSFFEHPRDGIVPELEELLGALDVLHHTISTGLLLRIEDLVMGHAFSDFLEQAEYLMSQGYHVPAGVLGRAVLEEHLQNWCTREGIMPTKARPTMNDFNDALCAAKHLNKADGHLVRAMAAVGNDSTHDPANVKKEDVERMLRDVRSFVTLH